MIKFLNVFLLGNYKSFSDAINPQLNALSLVNKNAELNFTHLVNKIAVDSLVDFTTHTVVNGFDNFGLAIEYSISPLIPTTTTTRIDALDVNFLSSEFSVESDDHWFEEEDLEIYELLQEVNPETKECRLINFVAPEHAFLNLECKQDGNTFLRRNIGFYPNDGVLDLYRGLFMGHIFGRELGDSKGRVAVEDEYYDRCKFGTLVCATADFELTIRQADLALKYIEEIDNACETGDFSKCSYNWIGRNCIDFVEDVAKAAEVKDNIFYTLKVSPSDEKPIFRKEFFSLSDKAWKYVLLKTFGKVNIQDPRDV